MLLEPADIRKHWDIVQPGVESILQKCGSAMLGYRPEDVYAFVLMGKAFLYTATDDPRRWIVFRKIDDQFSGDTVLLIWCAWAIGFGMQDRYRESVEEVARSIGATRIEWLSNRKGFEKTPGVVERYSVFSISVPTK